MSMDQQGAMEKEGEGHEAKKSDDEELQKLSMDMDQHAAAPDAEECNGEEDNGSGASKITVSSSDDRSMISAATSPATNVEKKGEEHVTEKSEDEEFPKSSMGMDQQAPEKEGRHWIKR